MRFRDVFCVLAKVFQVPTETSLKANPQAYVLYVAAARIRTTCHGDRSILPKSEQEKIMESVNHPPSTSTLTNKFIYNNGLRLE
jgi:hypothetical protein